MKRTKLNIIFLCALMLGGCGRKTELDDRSFVMAAGVDAWGSTMKISYVFPDYSEVTEQDKETESGEGGQDGIIAASFYEGERKFNLSSDKTLDYAHLKAIVLGEDMLCAEESLLSLLGCLENENAISANVLVFACEGTAAGILKADGQIDGSLGIYLKDMYEGNPYLTEEKAVTLGDLTRHWHNGDGSILIPILGIKDKKPQLTGYAVLHDMEYKGKLSADQGDLLFLANGAKADYYMRQSGYDIQVRPKQTEYTFQTSGGVPGCRAEITVEMRILGGGNLDGAMQKKLLAAAKEKLSREIAALLRNRQAEYGADLLNSFTLLASRDREMYFQYMEQREEYERKVRYYINCHV